MSDKLRSVNTRFWEDSFIEGLSPNEKLIFIYLLTNPLTNLIGIYEITVKRISYDTGLSKETILKALKRFESVSKVYYYENHIVLPNFLKNQSLNENMKTGVVKLFNQFSTNLKTKLLGNDYQSLSKDYQSLRNTLLKLKGNNEMEIEIEMEVKKVKSGVDLDFVEEKWKSIFGDWVIYKTARNEKYKTNQSLMACYNNLRKLSGDDIIVASQIVEQSMANNWAGLFPLRNNQFKKDNSEVGICDKYLK